MSISRRDFLAKSGAGAGLAAGVSLLGRPESDRDRPQPSSGTNVLWIMTDQQRWDTVGANGNDIIQTPNLDRLAEQSANFSRPFVQAPVCTPARASMQTGRYAHAHQNRVNYTPLDEDETLIQKRLQNEGYRTALVGKHHIYYEYPPTREQARRTGFDVVELHDGVGDTDPWSDYVKWRNANDPLADEGVYYRALAREVSQVDKVGPGDNPFTAAIADEYTDTTWTGRRSRRRLRRLAERDRPFFLYSNFWKPHGPYEVPETVANRYNDVEIPLPRKTTLEDIEDLPLPYQKLALRWDDDPYDMDRERLQWIYRSYYAAVSQVDREVGKMLETLEEIGEAENTIVIFSSEHGAQLLEHGIMDKNCFFESSIKVPLMMRFPGRIEPGTYDELIETIDILPTVFEFLGIEEPYHCHGKSFAPLITGNAEDYEPHEAVFCENIIPEVITAGSIDYQFEKGEGIKGIRHPDAKMVRTDRWKYNYYPDGYTELYDLEYDPGEYHDLSGDPEYRDVVVEMRSRLLEWIVTATETEQIAPRWLL